MPHYVEFGQFSEDEKERLTAILGNRIDDYEFEHFNKHAESGATAGYTRIIRVTDMRNQRVKEYEKVNFLQFFSNDISNGHVG